MGGGRKRAWRSSWWKRSRSARLRRRLMPLTRPPQARIDFLLPATTISPTHHEQLFPPIPVPIPHSPSHSQPPARKRGYSDDAATRPLARCLGLLAAFACCSSYPI